jgi:hypothetical protein
VPEEYLAARAAAPRVRVRSGSASHSRRPTRPGCCCAYLVLTGAFTVDRFAHYHAHPSSARQLSFDIRYSCRRQRASGAATAALPPPWIRGTAAWRRQAAQWPLCRSRRGLAAHPSVEACSYTNYGGADEERGLGLAQQPLAGTALTALLTQVSSGAGLGILQLSASPEHRALLSSHTPHELALVVVGLALSVGAEPEQLEPRNFLHLQQRHQLQKNERWTLASSLRWPTEPPSQVTVVACIQDTIGTMGDVSSSERQPHVVWAASAVRLLEKVEQRDPVLAKLLLQPQVRVHCNATKHSPLTRARLI